MGIEIEKKYRLSSRAQQENWQQRLLEAGATPGGEEFEENTLYARAGLDISRQVLRLRRIGERAILTYKERFATPSAIKHQREEETAVDNAEALAAILEALGFYPTLIYEKRRATWYLSGTEVVIDELPFGLFAEIEGDEHAIEEVEKLLNLSDTEAEHASYPELTMRHGLRQGEVTEARFEKEI